MTLETYEWNRMVFALAPILSDRGPHCRRQELRKDPLYSPQNVTVASPSMLIEYLPLFSYCCGAGTAADTEFTTNLISSQIELHSLSTGRDPRVVTVMTMLKQMLFK